MNQSLAFLRRGHEISFEDSCQFGGAVCFGSGEFVAGGDAAEVCKGERVEMEMVVNKFEKDRALSNLVSSVGYPNNGFSGTGDYSLTVEDGKTRLSVEV